MDATELERESRGGVTATSTFGSASRGELVPVTAARWRGERGPGEERHSPQGGWRNEAGARRRDAKAMQDDEDLRVLARPSD